MNFQDYLKLSIFGAGAFVSVIFILYLFISMILRGNYQVLLCMECDQCVKVCPIVRKYPNTASPKEIMEAAKVGDLMTLNEAGLILCNSCGACEKACPRGLAPYKEVEKLKIPAASATNSLQTAPS